MGLSCGVAVIKYLLFAFNLVFMLFSIAIIAIGSVQLVQLGDVSVAENLEWFPIVLIVVGVASFVIAFLGCCGAIRESPCLIYSYSTFMLIMLILQVAVGVIVLVNLDGLVTEIEANIEIKWNNRNQETEFWDKIQSDLQCCGLTGPAQWDSSVPKSCCEISVAQCTQTTAFQRGCSTAVVDEFSSFYGRPFAYVALGGAALALIVLVFSCILVNSIRNAKRRAVY